MIQWGDAVQLGNFPAILIFYCSQVGNGHAHEQCLSDSPFLGKGKMTTLHSALHEVNKPSLSSLM